MEVEVSPIRLFLLFLTESSDKRLRTSRWLADTRNIYQYNVGAMRYFPLTALTLEPLLEFFRHGLLNLAGRIRERGMEETFENVFGNTSSIHGRVIPSGYHEPNGIFNNDTSYSACGFVQDETEVILTQEAVTWSERQSKRIAMSGQTHL